MKVSFVLSSESSGRKTTTDGGWDSRLLVVVVTQRDLRAFEQQLSRFPDAREGAVRLDNLCGDARYELPRASERADLLRDRILKCIVSMPLSTDAAT